MSQTRPAAARFLPAMAAALLFAPAAAWPFPADLFGYQQSIQPDVAAFPQWLSALERHLRDDLRDGDCGERAINRCHMAQWLAFLDRVRALPVAEQLRQVNRYVNDRDYVLDLDNYGFEDYWAIPREHFANGGDCEDFAIAKYFSLRWLDYPRQDLRVVVVQDTNLRVAHAVLAVSRENDVLVLDNQVRDVLSHRRVVHYAPVYSINERAWWIHTPPAVAANR
jgi:predicted transglutaminase-like cysteine proteinase